MSAKPLTDEEDPLSVILREYAGLDGLGRTGKVVRGLVAEIRARDARNAEVERERDGFERGLRVSQQIVADQRDKLAAAEARAERLEKAARAVTDRLRRRGRIENHGHRPGGVDSDRTIYDKTGCVECTEINVLLAALDASPLEPAREARLQALGYEPVEPSDVPGMVRGAPEPAKGEGEGEA